MAYAIRFLSYICSIVQSIIITIYDFWSLTKIFYKIVFWINIGIWYKTQISEFLFLIHKNIQL